MTTTDFFDRVDQMAGLREKFSSLSSGGQLIFLWGRRRIGKTRLLTEFLKEHEGHAVYTSIVEGGQSKILANISNNIIGSGDIFHTNNWDDFFRYLNARSKNDSFIFVIDEFQRLRKGNKDIISRFQNEWDNVLKYNKIMIVICGSSIGMMKKLTIEDSAPLMGRPTWKFHLRPFSYVDFREMFSNFSEENKVMIYSIFGGTPDYLSRLKRYTGNEYFDMGQALHNLVLTQDGELYDEAENLLHSESKKSEKYLQILDAISSGSGNISKSDIEQRLGQKIKGFSRDSLGYFLQTLEHHLDLIRLDQPLFFKGKMGRYTISDNFFKFYFRFIYPNKRAIEENNSAYVLKRIQGQIDAHIGVCYEEIVKDVLRCLNNKRIKSLDLSFFKLGSWWNRNKQEIDVCAEGEEEILLGEVKWNSKPFNSWVPVHLEKKSKLVNSKKRRILTIFSRSGPDAEAREYMEKKKIVSITLADIQEVLEENSKDDWRRIFSPK